jgi:hypothetical protein
MRGKLPLAVVVLLAASALCLAQADPDPKSKTKQAGGSRSDQVLIDNSRATWEAYKGRDVAAIKALTAEDYVSHGLTGPSNLEQDIAALNDRKLTIESYTIDGPKVTWATKDVAILRYKCDLKGSFDGKPFRPVYATEVWVNRGGKWLIVSYTETPLG